MFKLLIETNYQPTIIYPAKLSFRYEGEIKTFPDIEDEGIYFKTCIAGNTE